MDAKTYQECALRTMANQNVILARLQQLGPTAMQLDNGARGLSDEVGEINAAVKAFIEYGKPLDRENIKEEVGDCFWRLRQICDAVGLTFEECMQANIEKLKIRYPKEFSDIQAHEENRDRAAEREVMTKNPSTVINEMDVAEEERLDQNGQGWAEPAEDFDALPPVVKCEVENGTVRLVKSFEEPPQSVVRPKPLNHSYTRYCKLCGIQPVHKTNELQICTPCFMLHGEVKELTYDTATTG